MTDSTYTVPRDAHGYPLNQQHHFDSPLQQFESGKMGMWVFLVTEVLFFGGLFCAYSIYRAHHPDLFKYGSTLLNWKMGAFNTVVLILSSFTMAWAVRAAQLGQRKILLAMLAFTWMFAGTFMVVKYIEYSEKFEHGYLWGTHYYEKQHHAGDAEHPATPGEPHAAPAGADPSGTPPATAEPAGGVEHGGGGSHVWKGPPPKNVHIFFGIYFFMTGLHGLHVLLGMVAIGWLFVKAARGTFGPGYFTPVDIVGLYWHLVDLIWIFLFPLLYLI